VHKAWKQGDKVLIRCQAGWNRSGLITALVLIKDGMDPAAAIDLIRERRSPSALCNRSFAAWLVEQGETAVLELTPTS
jgi:protein-tyrosine phosphatase